MKTSIANLALIEANLDNALEGGQDHDGNDEIDED